MLRKIINKLFAKQTNIEESKEIERDEGFVAAIEIMVHKDQSQKPKLNVLLDDSEESSINGLCTILGLCASEYFFLSLLEVVKEQFITHERMEDLEKILLYAATLELKDKVKSLQTQANQGPCIKPSDIQI